MDSKPDRKAFTLPELLMAMAITAVVGLAVVTVTFALSNAQAHAGVRSDAIQSARAGMVRIEAVLRKCKLVTGGDGGSMVCWMGDRNDDGAINLDEIIVIRHLSGSRVVELRQVSFPDTLAPDIVTALNQSRTLAGAANTAGVSSLMDQAIYNSYLMTVVLATEVEDLQIVPDAARPFSRLVLLRLTAGSAGRQITLTNSAVVRAPAVDSIEMVDGVPVLRL